MRTPSRVIAAVAISTGFLLPTLATATASAATVSSDSSVGGGGGGGGGYGCGVTKPSRTGVGTDNGWGNCGHDSGGGQPPSGDGPTPGNGGYPTPADAH